MRRADDRVGRSSETFELDSANVVRHLIDRGVLASDIGASVEVLTGGVSATVLAVRAPGVAVVAKQALARLRVSDEWRAKRERTELEAAALRLCNRLTPGRVPRLLDCDARAHVVVMELLPDDARNWQAEVAAGRTHVDVGAWAGQTLGIWHCHTTGDASVAAAFADFESFEQQRIEPFYETVAERLPEAAADVAARVHELRRRCCFVDGDFAMKNTLVGSGRNWVLDFEVVHYGNSIFDLSFFLSFTVLSAIRWPTLRSEMQMIAGAFLRAYGEAAGARLVPDFSDIVGHTGCLVLARTDGKSPAQFLDPPSRNTARDVGLALLRRPERGLWQWT
jgi:5-methylthioribose kinase